MNLQNIKRISLVLLSTALFLIFGSFADAAIDGISGTTTFNLTARADYISSPEGDSVYMWGYALDSGRMQYPGPTIIVNQGDVVTINLTNMLTVPTSIVFPGQDNVTVTGGGQGLLTKEARLGDLAPVTYTFTASKPGTFMYHSGTRPDLQIEMGLVGAIIVRPTGFDVNVDALRTVYGETTNTGFDKEFLFLLTEMDVTFHALVEQGKTSQIDNTTYHPVNWLINGRAAPDTMADAFTPLLPTQPYSSMVVINPGDKTLARIICAGRDAHPFHMHGNHFLVIGRDGNMLSSTGATADLAELGFTHATVAGGTIDSIYTWTGSNIGWDIYNHSVTDPLVYKDTVNIPPIPSAADEIFIQATVASDAGTQIDINAPDPGFPAAASFRAIIWPGADLFPTTAWEVVRLKRLAPGSTSFTVVARGLEETAVDRAAWCNIAFTDHGAPFPVILPSQEVLVNGQFFSGSPFLGSLG